MQCRILKYISGLVFVHLCSAIHAGEARVGINGAACAYESINEAIEDSSSGDTIFIKPGTYNELLGLIKKSLTFVPSEGLNPGQAGCKQEMLSASSTTVIVDGQGGSFDNQGGLAQISNTATVTFRHMWLRNSVADFGGIIAVIDGSGLTLDHVLITDGMAQQAGGSISVENDSELVMTNDAVIITGFSNGVGGAIALFDSSMTLLEGRVGVSNTEIIHANIDGGGIYADNSMLTFNSNLAQLQSNKAGRNGGGLYAKNSIITMSDNNISSNTADRSGGGMYLDDTELNMFLVSIDNNSSMGTDVDEGGGGIYITDDSVVNTRFTSITNNSSGSRGGGILADENTQLSVLINSSVENNLAATLGGGISISGSLTVDKSSILSNSAESGGGIYCHFCQVVNVLNDSSINDNSATVDVGGGIYVNVTANSHVTQINDSELLNNDSLGPLNGEGHGGAIVISAGSLNVVNSVFQNNQADELGGAIYASTELSINTGDSLNIQLDDVTFRENQSTRGGGLFIDEVDSLLINDSLFESNSSDYGGGAVFFDTELFEINNSEFRLNQSNLVGGAIQFLFADGVIKSSHFVGNESSLDGGALNIAQSDLDISNNSFTDNQASSRGGAINATGLGKIVIDANIGYGGGQCKPNELGFNEYCSSFTNNQANDEGGAIYAEGDVELNINTTAILGNNASAGSFIYVPDDSTDTVLNMENLLIAKNGAFGSLVTTIEVAGDTQVTMDSITLADNVGAPLFIPDSLVDVILHNSILFSNTSDPEISLNISSFIRSCNNSQTPAANSQSIGSNLGDPLFVTTVTGNYRLSAASPSRNVCTTGPADDLEGLARGGNAGLFDQGAFELDGIPIDPEVIFVNGFE